MSEETKNIRVDYYAMETASGAHFSGLRLDHLRSSPPPLDASFSSSAALTDSHSPKQPFIIGVSGGTASGKTTVCDMIIQQLHDHRVVLVNQDSFYRGLTPEESKHVHEYNFDHPDAFDTEELLECVEKLKLGQSVHVPIYDFKIHRKCADSFRQIRGMHTLIRDQEISTNDFVFYSDRLIRLVVEHGLGHLPFTEKQVVTPTGSVYTGVDFCKKLCGVSIVRSGESMENAMRACCKGIKIGKILIHRDGDNGKQFLLLVLFVAFILPVNRERMQLG